MTKTLDDDNLCNDVRRRQSKLLNLMRLMLVMEPNKRINASEALLGLVNDDLFKDKPVVGAAVQ